MSIYSHNKLTQFGSNDAWVKLFKLIPAGSRVLDIGCSSGNLGMALKRDKDVHVVGVDIDENDLKIAKKHLDAVHQLNVETDALSTLGRFDIIIMADVIEHLINPVLALKKIKHLLKPNGRLVFSIPNMANVTTRVELLKGRFEYKDFGLLDRTHMHFYDEKEVNRVFIESGFNVLKTDCTVRDIPEDILVKDLSSVGIVLTPKLNKKLKESKGLIYQFIGYAEPSNNPKNFVAQTTSDLDSVSKQMREMNEALEKKDQQILALNNKVKELQKRADDINTELQNIIYSRGWRLLSKAHKAKHIITHIGTRKK